MNEVRSLRYFQLNFDLQRFQQQAKGCPDEPEIIQALWQMVRPSVYWREERITAKDQGSITLGNKALVIDSAYVAQGLAECQKATLLAVTIGAKLPEAVSELLAGGNLYRGTIGDMLGSHSVEALAETFCAYLQERALPQGLFSTLRYSPGYGDWSLESQREVMACLEGCHQQIRLTENYLLEPVKSITAVIGWSEQWQKPEYPVGNHGRGFCNGGHNCAACVTWACRKD